VTPMTRGKPAGVTTNTRIPRATTIRHAKPTTVGPSHVSGPDHQRTHLAPLRTGREGCIMIGKLPEPSLEANPGRHSVHGCCQFPPRVYHLAR
jgi:hypothetical protein